MSKPLWIILLTCFSYLSKAQTPRSYTSAEILLQLKKLNVLGSVLYIAAHPDDENTRLLSWLANEKLYRTGYLSLTRGDGGQNLIGDEQGVDLGLIRTQELLAARRIDGAEQFFSRAFDFGFSKSPDEALRIWGHDKILSDVVWVIRKFRPDIIITRFPTTGEGGHGHHTASAILAGEAFSAAADPSKFPEQLKYVSTWQPKRLLWNTFNFGSTNTQSEEQFKLDCGDYNPILGKSYGEIAASSRSQHKSQGFGVPAQRGSVIEYFKTIKGDPPSSNLDDGINMTWDRTLSQGALSSKTLHEANAQSLIDSIIHSFQIEHPERSVEPLTRLYSIVATVQDAYLREQKLKEIQNCIEECSGLFIEATTNTQFAVQGDSLRVTLTINNRLGVSTGKARAIFQDSSYRLNELRKNQNITAIAPLLISPATPLTQPYWLENEMDKGSFNVTNQLLIGKGENDPLGVDFKIYIEGKEFTFHKPIRYKFTDPVKGELYQPLSILPIADIRFDKDVYLVKKNDSLSATVSVLPNKTLSGPFKVNVVIPGIHTNKGDDQQIFTIQNMVREEPWLFTSGSKTPPLTESYGMISSSLTAINSPLYTSSTYHKTISYDHIPSIVYQKKANAKAVYLDLKTEGRLVGYIPGAGDKIPEALELMGYKVIVLKENDITRGSLNQFDAIVTGVRAYNVNDWMPGAYGALMKYINDGGVFLVQYNNNNLPARVKNKIAPYPFTITSRRVTDEEARINFLLPDHPALNYPNKITSKDFEGWIQERSTYDAENIDTNYKRILSIKDPGEPEQDGSLIIANYGKGRFVYSGLVFFRELPAGIPGAYRLFANLLANRREKYVK